MSVRHRRPWYFWIFPALRRRERARAIVAAAAEQEAAHRAARARVVQLQTYPEWNARTMWIPELPANRPPAELPLLTRGQAARTRRGDHW